MFAEMHEMADLIDKTIAIRLEQLHRNISIINDHIQRTRVKSYSPYVNEYGDYGYATGVIVYWGVVIVLALTCVLYGVCIWKGMRGNWDLQRRITDEPNPKLAFTNPLNNHGGGRGGPNYRHHNNEYH